jgi:hypothetical protein
MLNSPLSRARPLVGGALILLLFAGLGNLVADVPVASARTLETWFLGFAFIVLAASGFVRLDGSGQGIGVFGMAVFGVVVAMFAAKLATLWSAGGGNEYAIGGLLPYNDATGYYDEARYFLENGRLKEMNVGRRPISSIVLAALLGLSGLNLQAAIALLVGLTTTACLVLARAIAWRYGWAAALVFAAVLYSYIDTYVGTTLSESAGMTLGCTGLALAWVGAGRKVLAVFVLGLAILTLGLLARAGAFFVLPALLIWAGYHFNAQKSDGPWYRNLSWKVIVAGALAIIAAFAFNKSMLMIYAPNDHVVFSNFPWTLYGIAVGGKGWTQVLVDHPHIADLPQAARIAEIYRLTQAAILDNPFNFVLGILHQYNEFFVNSGWHKFIDNKVVRGLVQLSALVALWVIFKRRRDWQEGFLFAALAGLFASIPALADGGPRVYAATQGLTAFVAAVGAAAIVSWIAARSGRTAPGEAAITQPFVLGAPLALGALMLGVLATGIGLSSSYQPAAKSTATCATGETAITARLLPGSYVQVLADEALDVTRTPRVRLSDFRAGIVEGGTRLHRTLKSQAAPFLLISAHAMGANAARWVIIPGDKLPDAPSTLDICGVADAPITRAVSWKVR